MENFYQLGDFDIDDEDCRILRNRIEGLLDKQSKNVAKWIEVHLRHLAKIHPTYIEDTRHFLERIEQINEKYAPLPPTTLLISWDIDNFYPSCDTEKVIEAARKRLGESFNISTN